VRRAGNPYLAELVASELAHGAVEGVAGAEARRLGRLGGAEMAVASAAAVADGAVSFAQLRGVIALDGRVLQSALRGLELERVLRTAPAAEVGDVVYDFYHARLRRAAYAQVEPDARRALHRGFATWLEAAARPAREAIAHHWEQAGEPTRAAPWAIAAADAAMDQLAFEHAARWYERALALGQPLDQARHAAERAAEALLWSGAFAIAADRCRELAAHRAGVDRERWLLRAAEAEIKLGELGPGLALIDRILAPRGLSWSDRRLRGAARTAAVAVRLVTSRRARRPRGDGEDQVLADAYRVVASFVSTPRPIEAFEYVLRSVALARRRGDRGAESTGLAMIAAYVAAGTLGRFGHRMIERSLDLAARSPDPYARMASQAIAVIPAMLGGRWAAMRRAHQAGVRLCDELGLTRSWEASFLRSYRVLGELYAGELDDAVTLAGDALGRPADLFTRAMIGSSRGRALAAAGRTAESARHLAELRGDPAAARGLPRMFRYALEGELALASAAWRDAIAIADEMARGARAEWLSILPAVTVMRDVIAATGELGAGGAAAARRARHLARRIGRRGRASFYAPVALRLEAQAVAALGDRARAHVLLGEAARLAEDRGGVVERAAIAALRTGAPPPERLRAAVAASTAGAVSA
jgi:hypothetical protein